MMALWELIETGFSLGIHVALLSAGFLAAISLVPVALWGVLVIMEKLKP